MSWQKGLLCLVIMTVPFTLSAQNIFFCKGLNADGLPIEAANYFYFPSASSYLYCLIKYPSHFRQANYFLKIEKRDDNNYIYTPYKIELLLTPYKTELLLTDTTKDKSGTDLFFTESGVYKVSLYDGNQTLASDTVSLKMNDNAGSSMDNADYNDPHSGLYFLNSTITFCDSVDEKGNAVNKSNIFSFRETGGLIMALLTNKNKPFKNNSVIVKTYVYDSQDQDYSVLAGESNYGIDPNAPSIKFTFRFRQRGEYLMDIFTTDNVLIIEGYVTLR